MGVLSTTYTFTATDLVTSTKLNNQIDETVFTADAIDGSTLTLTGTGKLKVSTGGITSNELATSAVTATKLATDAVETAKIAPYAVTNGKLGTASVSSSKIEDNAVIFDKLATAALATAAEMEARTTRKLVAADYLKYGPGVAKAHGSFTIATSARTLSGALNVSVTRIDANRTQVTFTSVMSSAAYTVVAQTTDSGGTAAGIDLNAMPYEKTTGGFKIYHLGEATDRAIDFVVFGTLA